MSKAYEQLEPYLERAQAFQTAKVLFEWDNETLAPLTIFCPIGSKFLGIFYNLLQNRNKAFKMGQILPR